MNIEKHRETIQRLWENSNHGTRLEDVESAFKAGYEACLARLAELASEARAAARRALG